MTSPTNSLLILFCVFMIGSFVLSGIEKRNGRLLSDEDRENIKNIVPFRISLPMVVVLTGFPIFFVGSFDYHFLLLVELALGLFVAAALWSYKMGKTNDLGLSAEYLEKAKKLNLALCIFNFVNLIAAFSLISAQGRADGFKIFLFDK